ncbi:hypothetical protein KVT40_001385 [Elsinoe batatas]|uniref:Uncharacterized protein n=1 Tax=Elsinoe batatas TaxID=2601811 RepID=A0A8K0L8L3_9PEZI|nr:hypothetical protein KVT40_001385 [Elsinoe batatas]
MIWFRVLEAYAVQALLRSEAFHGMVRKVHGGVQELKHGYGKHLVEQLREQAGIAGKHQGRLGQRLDQKLKQSPAPQAEDIHHTQRPSFLREFMSEVKKNASTGTKR